MIVNLAEIKELILINKAMGKRVEPLVSAVKLIETVVKQTGVGKQKKSKEKK